MTCFGAPPTTVDSFKTGVESCVSAFVGRSDWQGDLALGSLVALPALIALLAVVALIGARRRGL